MIFYKYKFSVNQNINSTFEYFLNRNYFKKHYQFETNEKTEIISENVDHNISENEEFDLVISDDETIITMRFTVNEIKKNEYIKMNFKFVKLIDREEGTLDDDLEFMDFIKKYIDYNFGYEITFKEFESEVRIVESGTLNDQKVSIFVKLLFKLGGIYYQLKQRKTYIKIKKEIESLKVA